MLRPLMEPECLRLGIAVAAPEWDRLERLGELWLQYGRVINLTGARSRESLAPHVLEGLLAVECVKRACGQGSWIDVGSGAGFPGLVAAGMGFDVTLVEPRERRASFLRLAAAAIAGEVQVVRARLDHVTWRKVGVDEVEWLNEVKFFVASARAVMAPERWLSTGTKLVQPEGLVVVHGSAGGAQGAPVAKVDWRGWEVAAYRTAPRP